MRIIMNFLRGVARILIFLLLVSGGCLGLLVCAWWPVRIRGIGLGPWLVHWIALTFARALNIHITVNDPAGLRRHAGFLFPNHTTYVDILVIMAATPVRFVAKAEIKRWPFIGWLAVGIGCVFVKRESRDSRQATRHSLRLIDHRPPVVLFPEGKTAPIGRLLPFRKGAYEIATEGEVSFMPLAIIYDDKKLIDWKTRPALVAWWEMLSRPAPLGADLHILDVVTPQKGSDPVQLMDESRAAMLKILIEKGGYEVEPAGSTAETRYVTEKS